MHVPEILKRENLICGLFSQVQKKKCKSTIQDKNFSVEGTSYTIATGITRDLARPFSTWCKKISMSYESSSN